jgi:hypothetical protein
MLSADIWFDSSLCIKLKVTNRENLLRKPGRCHFSSRSLQVPMKIKKHD